MAKSHEDIFTNADGRPKWVRGAAICSGAGIAQS